MAEILSQNEIDELLGAIGGDGGMDSFDEGPATTMSSSVPATSVMDSTRGKKVKIYDFKRPDKFSKDQMRTLNMMHETFVRLATTYLSTQLRTFVHMEVVAIDQITYEEFIRSLSNPTLLAVFNMGTLEGTSILEINLNVVFSIIDRLLGGSGQIIENIRTITPIEQVIIERIILKLLDNLRDAWQTIVELSPSLELIESNPQFTQIVPPGDMILLMTFEIKIGEVEGIINICIPYLVLEPVVGKLSATYWYSGQKKQSTSSAQNTLAKKISSVVIPFIVELGNADISIGDLLKLYPGDIIELNTRVGDDLLVRVGQQIKFAGRPGIIVKPKSGDIDNKAYVEEQPVIDASGNEVASEGSPDKDSKDVSAVKDKPKKIGISITKIIDSIDAEEEFLK